MVRSGAFPLLITALLSLSALIFYFGRRPAVVVERMRHDESPIGQPDEMMKTRESFKTQPGQMLTTKESLIASLPDDLKEVIENRAYKKPTITDQDLDDIYRKRKEKVKEICSKLDQTPRSISTWSRELFKLKDVPILFCPGLVHSREIKMAVELWDRGTMSARLSNPPSDSGYDEIRHQSLVGDGDEQAEEQFTEDLSSNMKVVFTRDPFWQIFEYYVDSILVPSKSSLEVIKMVYEHENPDSDKHEDSCGYRLSFSNFFNYMSSRLSKLDFAGTVRHCDVCGVEYDVIATEKTLIQDIAYVYNKQGNNSNQYNKEDIGTEMELQRIESYVETAFARKDDVGCISKHSMYERLWRQLQIWGFIDANMTLPFQSEESETMDYVTLEKVVLEAYSKSIPESRANTDLAFAQAYYDLDMGELQQMTRKYSADFFLFDYSDHPALVFFKQGPKPDINFFDAIHGF